MTEIEIIKQYAAESGTIVRSTSDLSPFEEWLLVKFSNSKQQNQKLNDFCKAFDTAVDGQYEELLKREKEINKLREENEKLKKGFYSDDEIQEIRDAHFEAGKDWILDQDERLH